MEFAIINPVLEDIQEELERDMKAYAESVAEREILALVEMEEDVPDEVKAASRHAFAQSGMGGLAAAAMDPHAHHAAAAKLHDKAAKVAAKAGLSRLAHSHQKRSIFHQKQAAALSPED
jgi:hypothetical protein